MRTIGETSRMFGVRPSTLRYWEDEGLVAPQHRRSGRRLYSDADLRTIALIVMWRETGLLELAEIRALMNGGSADRNWRDTISGRLDAIVHQQERLATARDYLEHLLTCPSEHPARDCTYLHADIDASLAARG